MSQISVSDMSFYYDGSSDNIFEHVSFQVDTDWKLGFIGRNGRGKTTFLNLLRGRYEYEGNISCPVPMDYFPFQVKNKEKHTIDILEEMDSGYEFWKVCRELTLLEVDAEVLYRPFSTLSSGEQTKVMLCLLFAKENHFLLIDEPTNHLDMETRNIVMEYLKKKKGFVLVSHDRWFLDGCVDHILSINKNDIEVVQGNFSTWWNNKKHQDEYELAQNAKLKKEIWRLNGAASQSKQWAEEVESTKIGKKSLKNEKSIGIRSYIGEKSKRMQMRRKNLERRQENAIEEKQELLQNIEREESLRIISLKHHKSRLITIEDLTVSYNGKPVLKGFDLSIDNGERVVLKGKNGCGKSSIIKIILGEEIQHQGKVEVAGGIIISYVSQDTSRLNGSLKQFIETFKLNESLLKALLRKMGFARTQFDNQIEEYSEGQKKKVLLAKSLCEQAHLYIWDEPLNFIDIFSRIQIEGLLQQYQPTMLMIEHDKAFVEKTATRTVCITGENRIAY